MSNSTIMNKKQHNKKTILLVEDESIPGIMTSKTLEDYGYAVILVRSGEKAVVKTLDSDIDLILMDINLGDGIDGTEAARRILMEKDIPIVFHTSHAEEEYVNRVREITRYGYVIKNSGDFVLHSSVEMAFELFEAHRETRLRERELESALASFQEEQRRREMMISLRLSLLDFSAGRSLQELLQKVLDEIGKFLESPIGFYHALNEDQTELTLQAWSTATLRHFCRAETLSRHYPIERAGVWADCIRTGRPVIHNDYKSLPQKKGMPEGHPQVVRELVVPVYRRGQIQAILGVGNKPVEYTQADVELVSYIADVTWEIIERKRNEEKLVKKKKQLDSALEAAEMGVWDVDIEGNKVEIGGEQAALFDLSLSEFAGTVKEILDIIHPDDREGAEKVFNETVNGKKEFDYRYRIQRQDGIRWMHSHGKLITSEEGSPQRITGTTRDVTEQTKTREEYRRIYHMASEMICVADINTATFLKVNPSFHRVLGWKEEELLGHPFLDFIHPDDIDRTLEIISSSLKKGIPVITFENRYRCKDGSYRWLDWNSHPVAEEGKTYAIAHDVTDRKNNEERIRKLLEEKEVLLQEVHHRIKNNMNTVISLLRLQAGEAEQPETAAALEKTQNRVQSMLVLYDRLYRSSDFRTTAVREYLVSLINEISANYQNRNKIEIKLDIDQFEMNVKAVFSLGIIINETISNAMKHAFEDDSGIITVSVNRNSKKISVLVGDNGAGLPDSFDVKSSSGFGLKLVDILVKQLEGTFSIESSGTGAAVRIELPPLDQDI